MKIKRKQKKRENGTVLVVGGCPDYVGAPALAGMAALRTGVDIVTVCAPEKVAWAINCCAPDLITKKFLGNEFDLTHCREIINMSQNYDVVLIGNGLGIKKDFVLKLLRYIKKPLVLDADALKVINLSAVTNSILTPHLKEFEILFTNSVKKKKFYEEDLDTNIKNFKPVTGDNVILLKGKEDHIFTKHRMHINKTGNDGMTVGGTGDILAGLCAGFLAQTKNLFESAKHAAYVNGRTGDHLLKQRGYSFIASDMINEMWRFIK
ncbi:NAD(P)H-hydrate dehydratase [Candidatus Woesearchaeota archaeon]|nr:NAD(P)H-hydrate dehydratase [Candidatus Woesearchaeota archaeon]